MIRVAAGAVDGDRTRIALDKFFYLHGRPGWGSAIVEAQLTWYGLPFLMGDSVDPLRRPRRARLRSRTGR